MRGLESAIPAPKLRLDMAALEGADVRCNLACSWCHGDLFPLKQALSTRTQRCERWSFTSAISQVMSALSCRPSELLGIYLSGRADPLIVEPLRLNSAIRDLRLLCPETTFVMTTNGLNLRTRAAGIREAGVDRVNISTRGEPIEQFLSGAAKAALQVGLSVHVNAPLTVQVKARITELVGFATANSVVLKLYPLLGSPIFRQRKELEETLDTLEEYLDQLPCEDVSRHRMVFDHGGGSRTEIKLLSNDRLRPDACNGCPEFARCVEGCWSSIRITPWYVKPCGLREDNIYFFEERCTETLHRKLASGGKTTPVGAIGACSMSSGRHSSEQ